MTKSKLEEKLERDGRIYICDGEDHRDFCSIAGINTLVDIKKCDCDPLERLKRINKGLSMDGLYEQSKLQWELDDMAYIPHLKKEIVELEASYHAAMNAKKYAWADFLRKVIDHWKDVLKKYEYEFTNSTGRGQVSPAQSGGSKAVFVLKK